MLAEGLVPSVRVLAMGYWTPHETQTLESLWIDTMQPPWNGRKEPRLAVIQPPEARLLLAADNNVRKYVDNARSAFIRSKHEAVQFVEF